MKIKTFNWISNQVLNIESWVSKKYWSITIFSFLKTFVGPGLIVEADYGSVTIHMLIFKYKFIDEYLWIFVFKSICLLFKAINFINTLKFNCIHLILRNQLKIYAIVLFVIIKCIIILVEIFNLFSWVETNDQHFTKSRIRMRLCITYNLKPDLIL